MSKTETTKTRCKTSHHQLLAWILLVIYINHALHIHKHICSTGEGVEGIEQWYFACISTQSGYWWCISQTIYHQPDLAIAVHLDSLLFLAAVTCIDICKYKDKDPFIGLQEFVVGYSKAPEQPQSSAKPMCHSHTIMSTGANQPPYTLLPIRLAALHIAPRETTIILPVIFPDYLLSLSFFLIYIYCICIRTFVYYKWCWMTGRWECYEMMMGRGQATHYPLLKAWWQHSHALIFFRIVNVTVKEKKRFNYSVFFLPYGFVPQVSSI